MNLLPPKILHKRQQINLYKKMAAVQAVIFLLSILLVIALTVAERTQERQILKLNAQVQNPRFQESEALARAIQENHMIDTDSLNLDFPNFDITKIIKLKETLPKGVQLIHFDTDAEMATLIAQTDKLSLTDIHRDAWVATGLVYQTRLVSAVYFDDGVIQYALSIIWDNQ